MSDDSQATVNDLSATRVAELRDSGRVELIDVRRNDEFEAGRLPGARQVEVNDVTAQAEAIPKDRMVVFYCRSGNRSGMVAQAFAEAGWDAHNLAGGIAAWVDAGLPLEPADGEVSEGQPPSA